MNPFRQIPTAGSGVSEDWLAEQAPRLAIAVGLASRQVGG
jgi:hypothetical protein